MVLREGGHHRLLHACRGGVFTVQGVMPPVLGSATVTDLLLNGLRAPGRHLCAVEPDPAKAADLIIKHVEGKRRPWGWRRAEATPETARKLAAPP